MVAPASDRRSPPITLDSLDCANPDANAATCCVSSPRWPATAQAKVSSSRLLQWSRAGADISSYRSDAAKSASTSVTFPDISFSLAPSGLVPPAVSTSSVLELGAAGNVKSLGQVTWPSHLATSLCQRGGIGSRRIDLERGGGETSHREAAGRRHQRHQALLAHGLLRRGIGRVAQPLVGEELARHRETGAL